VARADLRRLAGFSAAVLRNQSVDLIDAAVGPGHARAALVALQEGTDTLFQATLELAESAAREQVLARVRPADPLGLGERIEPPESEQGMRVRLARTALEQSAVLAISALDHLANAHVRFAWEANAATEEEARLCGFDPAEQEPRNWISLPRLRDGVNKLPTGVTGVFHAFELNEPLVTLADEPVVRDTRELRNQIVHRARPAYREAPAFGRTSLWAQHRFRITFPRPAEADDHLLPLAARRVVVAGAVAAGLPYAQALWALATRWLRTVGVTVIARPGEVRVTSEHDPVRPGQRYPRAQRDPAPFLRLPSPA
jgi:hypothetical protein